MGWLSWGLVTSLILLLASLFSHHRVVAFIAPVIKIILHASNAISYPILRPFGLRLAAIWVA